MVFEILLFKKLKLKTPFKFHNLKNIQLDKVSNTSHYRGKNRLFNEVYHVIILAKVH